MAKAEIGSRQSDFIGNRNSSPIDGMEIVVVGAGAAGLSAAKKASEAGARVKVLERASDPRLGDAGYTNRSFNFTLNTRGREELGDPRMWEGGVIVNGRAVHTSLETEPIYTTYGTAEEPHHSISIPRPVFRQNGSTLAEEVGASLIFGAQVIDINAKLGKVVFDNGNGKERSVRGDLIVVADGLHSFADRLVTELPGGMVKKELEPLSYITGMLYPETGHNLSKNHLHFWNQPGRTDSFAVGVPNNDGSIAVLFVSMFADFPRDDLHPFKTPSQTAEILKRDFPQVLALDPNLPKQLTGRDRGNFYYKSTSHVSLGPHAVVAGDAAHAVPPWAGLGANTAIFAAGQLIRSLITHNGDIATAMQAYEEFYRELSPELHSEVKKHGELLSTLNADNATLRSGGQFTNAIDRVSKRVGEK